MGQVCIPRASEGAPVRRQEARSVSAVPQELPRRALAGEARKGRPRREQLRVQRLRQVLPGEALAAETRPKRSPPDEEMRLKLGILALSHKTLTSTSEIMPPENSGSCK